MTTFQELTRFTGNSTLKSVHRISRLMGRVRRELSPPHPHWWHVSLEILPIGLSTGAIPGGEAGQRGSFHIDLNMIDHRLVLGDEESSLAEWPINGLRLDLVGDQLVKELTSRGHAVVIDQEEFESDVAQDYDPDSASKILSSLQMVDRVFKVFRQNLGGERGPVHLWPHHFDLAFVRFTGRLAPDVDSSDVESAKEQVNHGFVFGDDIIGEPYFYIIPYPIPNELTDVTMPEATLHREGFTGYVLPWNSAAASSNPQSMVEQFLLETTHILKKGMEG